MRKVLLWVLMFVFLAGSVYAVCTVESETQITTDTADQWDSVIYGDKIVWFDYRSGDSDIYTYDLSTSTETKITTNTAGQQNPAIYGDKIVWDDYRDDNTDIYTYDLSTSTETKITTNTAGQRNPEIYGDKIIWEDGRNGNEDIYMYDLNTSTETQITNNTAEQIHIAIYGDKIVWQDNRNGNWDIYMYDLSTSTETQITNNTAEQYWPAIYGDKIIWTDYRNGNAADIYTYDLSTSTETPITQDTINQPNPPAIYGNKIVWDDHRNGNDDVHMYDLSTSTEIRITTNTAYQEFPVIYGDKIIWRDNRNGNYDVYMSTLSDGCFASCTIPTDGMRITEDTTFCPGTYDLPNGITIWVDNVELDCDGAVLEGNMTQKVGIGVYGDYNNIKNCKITSYQEGFDITGNHNHLTLSEISENMYGISLYGQYNLIDYSKIIDSIYRDLNMAGSLSEGYNTIKYNEIGGSEHSVYLYNSGYNDITLNTLTSVLKIESSVTNNVTTIGNRIWNNNFYEYGVIAYNEGNLDDNLFCVNGIGNNYYNGATGPTCPSCTTPTDGMSITENTTFCSGTYNLPNGITIDADNIVLDCDGAVLDGTGLNTGIDIQSSSGVTVKNCDIRGYHFHIGLSGINNIVQNNIITNNGGNWGIVLGSSINSLVYNNTLYMNNSGNGIVLSSSSSNNNITNNKLYDGFPDGVGIGLEAVNNNTINNNLISNFVVGLQLSESSHDNVIEENILVNNSLYGIQFFESYDNIIRRNSIISNNIGIIFENYASTGNIIEFNNIYNNTGYELYNNIAQDITAENNYWGTMSMSEINNRIFDHNDDIFKGSVYYCPILNDSYPYGGVLSNVACVIRIDILVFINNPIKYSTITNSFILLDVTTSKNTTCMYSVNICNGSDITKGGNCTELRNGIMGITGSQSHLQLVENFTDTKQDEWYRLGVSCSDDSNLSSSGGVPFYVNMVSNTTPATCPTDMADLIVLDVNTPENAMAGDSIALGATIKNQDHITTFFWAEYELKGPTNSYVTGPTDLTNPIEPSEVKTIASGITSIGPLEEGINTITVIVHSESPDCNLSNNNMTETFYVSASIPEEGFMINITNPISGSTINTHSTLLDAMTNKFATCSYKLDSDDYAQFSYEEHYLLPNLNYGNEINDLLRDIPLDEGDLPLLLAQGLFRDLIGQTDNDVAYSQKLYFVSTAPDNMDMTGTGQLVFGANDDGDKASADYLVFDDDSADYTYHYNLIFDTPVQYTATAEHPPDEDLEGSSITIQGDEFTIIDVKYNVSYVINKLTLITGDLLWLASNTSITRVVNGIEHKIGVVNATETMCGVNVDGDVVWIDKGNSQTINGVAVAVMDAIKIINTSESICKLAVGASEYILENGKEVKVNGVKISGSEADLIGTAGNWEGFEVRYTPNDEEYIPTGSSLVDPIFGNFGVYFNGITKTTEEMRLTTHSDNAEFTFINNHGVNVIIPFYYNGSDINLGDDFSASNCDGRLLLNGETCDSGSSLSDIEGTMFLMTTSDGEAHVMEISDITLATDQDIMDIKDLTYGKTYADIPVIFNSPTDLTLDSLGTITLTMTEYGSITFNSIFLGGLPKTSYGALIDLSKDSVFIIEENDNNDGLIWNLSLYYYPTLNEVRIALPNLLEGAQGPQWNNTDLRASKSDKYTRYSATEWGTLVKYDSYDKNDLTLWYPDKQAYGSAYILHGGLSHKENLTNLADGQHTIGVECTDLNGNSNTTSITFNVDTIPPLIGIINPLGDSTINTDSVWLNATTNEDAVCEYSVCKFSHWAAPPCEEGPCQGGWGGGGCSRPKNMSVTNGTSHLQLITGLKNTINNETYGENYRLDVKCKDNSGNSNHTSVVFYVDIPPLISKISLSPFATILPPNPGEEFSNQFFVTNSGTANLTGLLVNFSGLSDFNLTANPALFDLNVGEEKGVSVHGKVPYDVNTSLSFTATVTISNANISRSSNLGIGINIPVIIAITNPLNDSIITDNSTWLNVTTDRNSECSYILISCSSGDGVNESSGCNGHSLKVMNVTHGTEHTQLIEALSNTDSNKWYELYVSCMGSARNSEALITFTVNITPQQDTASPPPNDGGGNGDGGGSSHHGGGYAPFIGGTTTPPSTTPPESPIAAETQGEANPSSEDTTEADTGDNQPEEQGGLGGITGAVVGALKKPVARTTAILIAVMVIALLGIYLYREKRKIKLP